MTVVGPDGARSACSLHLMLLPVDGGVDGEPQVGMSTVGIGGEDWSDEVEAMYRVDAGVTRFETVTVGGRAYVVAATPFDD